MSNVPSRRSFLYWGAILPAVAPLFARAIGAQQQSDAPPRPKPDGSSHASGTGGMGSGSGQGGPNFPAPSLSHRDPISADEGASPTVDPKGVLKANDKDIKSNVLRLAELAEELKKVVEVTDSANVLSLPMVHKAEEIERLAHHIATLARG